MLRLGGPERRSCRTDGCEILYSSCSGLDRDFLMDGGPEHRAAGAIDEDGRIGPTNTGDRLGRGISQEFLSQFVRQDRRQLQIWKTLDIFLPGSTLHASCLGNYKFGIELNMNSISQKLEWGK